ncbi:MAG: transglycosylase SLT domain-containing protein [Xanthomonadaceae bacterium]|jgi:membrane-bound lytic murein transglycosylase D|nr:transglycosylase SLT domain-containing protein [Xanthomonadaceae bacterium]
MPSLQYVSRVLSFSLAIGLSLSLFPAQAQRVSARDRTAIEALNGRMAAAEQRYRNALVRVGNNDPRGVQESNAALEDMEDVMADCARQRHCPVSDLLATYKRLLKTEIDNRGRDSGGFEEEDELLAVDSDHDLAADGNLPEALRAAAIYNDQRHAFDRMVEYNPAIQAGIRRWLTDMRPSLMNSYENYQNLRSIMWPRWEQAGLPEALLFGIMAKESNGRVHAASRSGAAGLMQFMPATGRRFGMGPDGTGFDTRYDPDASAVASAAYINERMGELNRNIEYALAGYNGGEGRALRMFNQSGGASFWTQSVYEQFPAETKDYVPMVIAAAWLFLHPRQYGIEFPRVNVQPATLRLARQTSIYELTICLGNAGTRDGYMRTLRNLNPRYEADAWIPAGTQLNANNRIVSLYNRHCVNGQRAELARTLMAADISAALIRPTPLSGSVAVGDATSVQQEVPAPPAPARSEPASRARAYRVVRGDTLGGIAQRFQCNLNQLARANGLRGPRYHVNVGQTIRLQGCRR